jgi:GNAT superfamily N-acetyltransferase
MASPAAGTYPHDLERDVVLKDGTSVRLRPIRSDDAPRLIRLYERLSQRSAYQRFFTVMKRLPPDWARVAATVDYVQRLALVALPGPDPAAEIVAVGRWEPTAEPAVVEVAFAVEDGWQNRGLGSVLFRTLLEAAVARGFRRFRAFVLGDNRRMLDLITRFTDVRERSMQAGVVEVLFAPAGADGAVGPPP